MTDNQLLSLLRAQMIQALATKSWSFMEVLNKDQPTQQGLEWGPGVYLEKLFDNKYGWPSSSLQFNATDLTYDDDSNQVMETTYQVSSLAIQDPTRIDLPTAADIVNHLSGWLSHPSIIQAFKQRDVGLLRVSKVQNVPFEDDRGRFEYHPSFDVVLRHNQSLTIVVPSATVEGNAIPVLP